ncbi:MAG: S8 family serine peptidase [Candidatus Krumholzibacteria bacterium]|nr:S8 family serine peptidase [Candidatus Krumholzibacteria bacterium]
MSTTQTGATWGIDRIDQTALPLSGTYTYNYTGSGVKAYIIDTGILYTHTDFGGRAIYGVDEISSSNGGVDQNGHGTHVSGTVGGTTYGVAKGVTLVAVRVLDASGSGTTSGVVAGIDWVTSNHASGELAVANMSLGGAASTTLDNAVIAAINDGVTFCVAAGNNGALASNYSPARVAAAITVGATSSTDVFASWSNYGSAVDVNAPGVSIKSDYYTSTTATATMSGTSMASPHVTGVAALYLAQFPTATPATIHAAIVAAATPNVITSIKTGTPNLLLYSLFGTPTVPSAPTLSSPTNGATAVSTSPTLSWAASSGATSYRYQVSTSSDFSVTLYDASTSSTSVALSVLAASTTYYWRVNATNTAGTSDWSSVYSFTTASSSGSAPSAPTLISPTNGATSVSRTPTLSWAASTGATSYSYQVSTSSSFSTIARSGTTTSTSVTISSSLSKNTTYYWRVNATNTYGTSAWSSVWNFKTRNR